MKPFCTDNRLHACARNSTRFLGCNMWQPSYHLDNSIAIHSYISCNRFNESVYKILIYWQKLPNFHIFRGDLQMLFITCFDAIFPLFSVSSFNSPNFRMNAIWQKELNDYLSTIEHCTASSLRKIQTDFTITGMDFDKKFRKNFLRITNNR